MSEQQGMGAAVPDEEMNQAQFAGASAGEILRQAREAAGVHIAALAVALKVPVSKIDALETGRFDEFPDNVFMRALAASVCRTLKIESAPVLALLPSGGPQTLNVTSGLNASFKDPTGRFKVESSLERPNKSRWVGAAVVVLLVGALAVAFFPHKDASSVSDSQTGTVAPDASGGAATGEPREAVATVEPVASEAVANAATTAPAATSAAVTPVAQAAASAPAAVASAAVAAAMPASAAVPGDPSNVLEIRAREASWIKIVSAVNGVVLQRELKTGETVVATGAPPFNVTVGRPDSTDVIVRGQPMSMSNYPRGAVARFEVK
ncbi:helix-turn-helix domain-containing protein [Diaphorobacter sp. HDW4B]|uniref:helix-turn-helix domain-containing protein n=1 Tax=Diaphorobacter sp. HDW4B TaxID=2714925 RepID=UPI001F0EB61C|nr:helix-turn-helix domain-containing protein [Diaphorobacter sp. HDW4B]